MLVEKCFVINLKIRPDRLREFHSRWPNVDYLPRPEVWHAVHGDTCIPPDCWTAGNGAWGCRQSHLGILEYCLNNNIGSYLVFEDDAQFAPFFEDYTRKVLENLPSDWQQIYLGGQLLHEHAHPPVQINEFIYKPYNVNRTHAFAVSRDGMVDVYRWLNQLPYHGGEHIDHHLGRLHETDKFQVYCPGQWVVGQGGSSSNVSGKTDPVMFWGNPESFALSHWLYKRPVCVVLRAPMHVARELEPHLHFGHWRDNAGYDKGLTIASKFRYPGPEITKWYSAIRAEVVREGMNRLPCLYHPMITDDMIAQASMGKVIVIDTQSSQEALEKLELSQLAAA